MELVHPSNSPREFSPKKGEYRPTTLLEVGVSVRVPELGLKVLVSRIYLKQYPKYPETDLKCSERQQFNVSWNKPGLCAFSQEGSGNMIKNRSE